jgi:hypothetical protein
MPPPCAAKSGFPQPADHRDASYMLDHGEVVADEQHGEPASAGGARPFVWGEHGAKIQLTAWTRNKPGDGKGSIGARRTPIMRVEPSRENHPALKKKAHSVTIPIWSHSTRWARFTATML